MSTNLNSINVVGNLTRDAELIYTNTGCAISKISIAANRRVKKNDQWIDEVSYFDLVGFGDRYKNLNQYLLTGTTVGVTGYLKQERWEKDGQKRSRIVIVIDSIQLLGGKKDNKSGSPQNQHTPSNSSPFGGGVSEDKIPF